MKKFLLAYGKSASLLLSLIGVLLTAPRAVLSQSGSLDAACAVPGGATQSDATPCAVILDGMLQAARWNEASTFAQAFAARLNGSGQSGLKWRAKLLAAFASFKANRPDDAQRVLSSLQNDGRLAADVLEADHALAWWDLALLNGSLGESAAAIRASQQFIEAFEHAPTLRGLKWFSGAEVIATLSWVLPDADRYAWVTRFAKVALADPKLDVTERAAVQLQVVDLELSVGDVNAANATVQEVLAQLLPSSIGLEGTAYETRLDPATQEGQILRSHELLRVDAEERLARIASAMGGDALKVAAIAFDRYRKLLGEKRDPTRASILAEQIAFAQMATGQFQAALATLNVALQENRFTGGPVANGLHRLLSETLIRLSYRSGILASLRNFQADAAQAPSPASPIVVDNLIFAANAGARFRMPAFDRQLLLGQLDRLWTQDPPIPRSERAAIAFLRAILLDIDDRGTRNTRLMEARAYSAGDPSFARKAHFYEALWANVNDAVSDEAGELSAAFSQDTAIGSPAEFDAALRLAELKQGMAGPAAALEFLDTLKAPFLNRSGNSSYETELQIVRARLYFETSDFGRAREAAFFVAENDKRAGFRDMARMGEALAIGSLASARTGDRALAARVAKRSLWLLANDLQNGAVRAPFASKNRVTLGQLASEADSAMGVAGFQLVNQGANPPGNSATVPANPDDLQKAPTLVRRELADSEVEGVIELAERLAGSQNGVAAARSLIPGIDQALRRRANQARVDGLADLVQRVVALGDVRSLRPQAAGLVDLLVRFGPGTGSAAVRSKTLSAIVLRLDRGMTNGDDVDFLLGLHRAAIEAAKFDGLLPLDNPLVNTIFDLARYLRARELPALCSGVTSSLFYLVDFNQLFESPKGLDRFEPLAEPDSDNRFWSGSIRWRLAAIAYGRLVKTDPNAIDNSGKALARMLAANKLQQELDDLIPAKTPILASIDRANKAAKESRGMLRSISADRSAIDRSIAAITDSVASVGKELAPLRVDPQDRTGRSTLDEALEQFGVEIGSTILALYTAGEWPSAERLLDESLAALSAGNSTAQASWSLFRFQLAGLYESGDLKPLLERLRRQVANSFKDDGSFPLESLEDSASGLEPIISALREIGRFSDIRTILEPAHGLFATLSMQGAGSLNYNLRDVIAEWIAARALLDYPQDPLALPDFKTFNERRPSTAQSFVVFARAASLIFDQRYKAAQGKAARGDKIGAIAALADLRLVAQHREEWLPHRDNLELAELYLRACVSDQPGFDMLLAKIEGEAATSLEKSRSDPKSDPAKAASDFEADAIDRETHLVRAFLGRNDVPLATVHLAPLPNRIGNWRPYDDAGRMRKTALQADTARLDAIIKVATGASQPALAAFDQVWDLPNAGPVWNEQLILAQLYIKLGQPDVTRGLLERAARGIAEIPELSRSSAAARFYLMDAYRALSLGQWENALQSVGVARQATTDAALSRSSQPVRVSLAQALLASQDDVANNPLDVPELIGPWEKRGAVPITPLAISLKAVAELTKKGVPLRPELLDAFIRELDVGTTTRAGRALHRAAVERRIKDPAVMRMWLQDQAIQTRIDTAILAARDRTRLKQEPQDTLFPVVTPVVPCETITKNDDSERDSRDSELLRLRLVLPALIKTDTGEDFEAGSQLHNDLARLDPGLLKDLLPSHLDRSVLNDLTKEEAVVAVIATGGPVMVAILRSDEAKVFETSIDAEELAGLVKKIRSTIFVDGKLPSPDMSAVSSLSDAILVPQIFELKDVKRLLLLPRGSVESIPAGLLQLPLGLRAGSTTWLSQRYNITVLPGLSPLSGRSRQERVFKEPFLAFADPAFLTDDPARCNPAMAARLRLETGEINTDLLRSYCRVAATWDTALSVARKLGLGDAEQRSAIFVGADASEHTVETLAKSGRLQTARIIMFGTHGLLAAETLRMAGLNEPALVLTPPAGPVARTTDDGLLTMTEIARLDIGAEWVVLNACNTAASDGSPGGEGLSGLASAFLEAGAQGVIVSHWPVSAKSSTLLLGKVFELWNGGQIPMDKAVGQAMQWMRTSPPGDMPAIFSNPPYWAPFVVVGR